MTKRLTPRQVAEVLGVSESSLKRWCDRGKLQFEKTAGGHRRISVPSVVHFIRENRREVVRPEILGLNVATAQTTDCAALLDDFATALLRGDTDASRRIVLGLFLAGVGVARIGDELLTPVLARVGDQWEHGQTDIFEEHRAIQIVFEILHDVRQTLTRTSIDTPVAIGCSIEGDPYGLPTKLVELSLLDQGWDARSFGTSMPTSALMSAVHQHSPTLVWISASVIPNAAHFVSDLNSFCMYLPPGTSLAVGGRGIDQPTSAQLAGPRICGDLREFSAYADSLREPADQR